MKYIVKQGAPLELNQWLSLANEDWIPSFDKLQNPEKTIVRNSLHAEQHGLCCYCESAIPCDCENVHIEHLNPQSQFPELQLDYGNLLLSCNGLEPDAIEDTHKPCHCGKLKDALNPQNMISPLDPDCESFFHYTYDGFINPSPCSKSHLASSTITYLGLNTQSLVRVRKNVFAVVFGDPEALLSNEEILSFVESKIALGEDGMYESFWTVWNQIRTDHIDSIATA
jgi:uncharacterized protein (TIGR02646 family)